MNINYYHIDVFASCLLEGNPAIVCVLPHGLKDAVLQSIALEFNQVVTFLVIDQKPIGIRWFTVNQEISPCGHGTLAATFVLKQYLLKENTPQQFTLQAIDRTLSLDLSQTPTFELDEQKIEMITMPANMVEVLGKKPQQFAQSEDRFYAFYQNEQEIISLSPNFDLIKKLGLKGLVVSAPGAQYDFVSRTFAPNIGINEDYVTGSSHAGLVPFWAKQLNKNELVARQLSKRPGDLQCQCKNKTVGIAGQCRLFTHGEFILHF